jgi:hypothetical protein
MVAMLSVTLLEARLPHALFLVRQPKACRCHLCRHLHHHPPDRAHDHHYYHLRPPQEHRRR